ncbi:recombinase family protein [Streptacidiphilus sp. EB129]|uniref:recombinase family protein n=1 Tax=Streptacidiphilus sp. EB129 TaxID=3156262 RepID=UPI003512EEAB
MSDEAVKRVQWGDLTGQSWAGLTRLSTEEAEGELDPDRESEKPRYITGRDIKSRAEQEKDNRAFVEARGGRYVYTYTEPDTSAWKRKRVRQPDGQVVYRVIRPIFEGALRDLKAGRAPNGERIDGLMVYDIDRLTRDPRHLEDAIEVVEQHHRPIIDITGSLDLLTDNGRAMARVITAMNNKSSADTSRRVKRKHKAMRDAGIPTGGPRPYGWQKDRRTLEPTEAKHLRDAAHRILTGAAVWSSIVAEWNRTGVRSASGKKWTIQTLRQVLRNPRICGYRSHYVSEFNPETQAENRYAVPVYDDEGQPVKGQQDPILTVEQWQAITYMIENAPRRGTGRNARVYLLSGILRCGKDGCGMKMRAMKASPGRKKPEGYYEYLCPSGVRGPGCGGVAINGYDADELVRKMIIAKHELEAEERDALTAAGEWSKESQLERVREDIAAARAARRTISAERYYQDLAEYEAEERALIKERNAWQRRSQVVPGQRVDMAKEWDREGITLAERRAYVENAYLAIVVHPVGKGRRVPLRDRLDPIPNNED